MSDDVLIPDPSSPADGTASAVPTTLTCVSLRYVLQDEKGGLWMGRDLPAPGQGGGVMAHLLPETNRSAHSIEVKGADVVFVIPPIPTLNQLSGRGTAVRLPVELQAELLATDAQVRMFEGGSGSPEDGSDPESSSS